MQAKAPVEDMYVSTAQSSHAVLTPAAALYLPAAQLVQTEAPAAEYVPAPHSAQEEATLAPRAPENLPAVQLVQTDEPATPVYFPPSQLVQAVDPAAA